MWYRTDWFSWSSMVAGAGLAEVKEAMTEFLEALHDSFDDLASDGHSIVLEGDVLSLHIALQAWGGPECGEASDLANGMGSICREPGYVELLDFDTGDSTTLLSVFLRENRRTNWWPD